MYIISICVHDISCCGLVSATAARPNCKLGARAVLFQRGVGAVHNLSSWFVSPPTTHANMLFMMTIKWMLLVAAGRSRRDELHSAVQVHGESLLRRRHRVAYSYRQPLRCISFQEQTYCCRVRFCLVTASSLSSFLKKYCQQAVKPSGACGNSLRSPTPTRAPIEQHKMGRPSSDTQVT